MRSGTGRLMMRFALGYLIAFWIVDLLFKVELMHYSGRGAFYVSVGLLLVAVVLTAVLGIGSLRLLITTIASRGARTDALRAGTVFAVLALGPLIGMLFPDIAIDSFLWRHEKRFLEDIQARFDHECVRHYPHGSVFMFSWYTISNSSFFIVYEPERPIGGQLLGRDTDRFYPQGHVVRHMRGPWYCVFH